MKKNHERKKTQSNNQPIRYIAIGFAIALVFVALLGVFAGNSTGASVNNPQTGVGSTAATVQKTTSTSLVPVKDGVQEVTVAMQGYEYTPNPIRVKVGIPVRMVFDLNTVQGCMRNVVLSEIGVSGQVYPGQNVIEFTPSRPGTFRMTCSMGMAKGTLLVEDKNGTIPGPTAAYSTTSAGGSCSAGGCGCGRRSVT